MECRGGAHALLEGYLSVGAAACDALHCQRWEVNYLKLVQTLKEPNNRLTDLGYAWVVFIVGDTLRHQPMVVSHMSVLQFRGPITYCVLQWCHPMLTVTQRRTSCSTRMITLYGDHVIKLDSGPRMVGLCQHDHRRVNHITNVIAKVTCKSLCTFIEVE